MSTHRTPTTPRTHYTADSDRLPAGQAAAPTASGQAVAPTAYSSESGRTYRLDRLIGKGGFGEVYLATATSGSALPARVCVKISDRISSWLREAYFAELLAREKRALRVFDRFAEVHDGQMRYCLAMEYAEHGDLGAWLGRTGAQSERFVRREIAAILGALDAVHRGHALHRDLTPFNVFVCEGEQLKLGDFGIATHQLNPRGVTADAFNLFHVPNEIAWGKVRRWQKRDDIYQIGLLAAMLLRGDIASPMHSKDVRKLPCSDHLKEVIHCCLGSRGKRYEAASELIAALRKRPKEPKLGRVNSLAGKRLSFTGFLVRPRDEAITAAKKAGAIVQSKPGKATDLLVRGRPNALQIAGKDGGSKLIEVRRLAAQGIKVTVIGESQFWRLAQPRSRPRKKPAARTSKARRS
ncbi:MAG TPA: protein kinase [Gemmatimonadaceae bacterium]|nr:protein kinase [Gemmatimonadaceae bacterium]